MWRVAAALLAGLIVLAGLKFFDFFGDPEVPTACDGATSVRLMPLREIDSENAVVFVHGLGSTPCAGFSKVAGGKSWPDVVAEDSRQDPSGAPAMSTYAVYAVDYRAVFASNSSIEEAASQVQRVILSTPLGPNGENLLQKHNNIWIIAHSLGGVIMKRVLVRMADQRLDRGLGRIKGIFLFGVPSRGAPLADLSRSDLIAFLSRFVGDYDVVRDLAPSGAAGFLDATENAWTTFFERHRERFYVGCGYEKSPDIRFINANLVPELFSSTACSGQRAPFAYDHFDLVKVDSIDHDVHIWTRARLVEAWLLLQKAPLFVVNGGGQPLKTMLDNMVKGGGEREAETGVKDVPEVIGYADAASEKVASVLGLGAGEYAGPSLAAVIDRITSRNKCLDAQADAARRHITIRVEQKLDACTARGASIETVCSGVRC